jgi:PAS domain S-box-containing protein
LVQLQHPTNLRHDNFVADVPPSVGRTTNGLGSQGEACQRLAIDISSLLTSLVLAELCLSKVGLLCPGRRLPSGVGYTRTFDRRPAPRQLLPCVVSALGVLLISMAANGKPVEESKRVLVVHSVASGLPSSRHAAAFETELTEGLEEKVDLDEVFLDHIRYADPDMQEALVSYLEKRRAKWQPDLVVAIGSPAGIFVGQYRERLFPQTPILYSAMDQRRLLPGALQQNAAYVGANFDILGSLGDVFQLAPDTTNIVCVVGASPIEQFWKSTFQKQFGPFTNRASFTWVDGLPFEQVLELVKKLPPHTFILFIMLLHDAAGVTQNADKAVKQLSEAANAPVIGMFDHQLGLGIVGGRLFQTEYPGVLSARTAIRILRGEAASNFPPQIVKPTAPQYDWRQLRRWKISEKRLPPGSIVNFRLPTTWERHRFLIVSTVLVLLLQAIWIAGLVLNSRRRRRAERLLRENKERMRLAAAAAKLGMWEWDLASNKVWVDTQFRQKMAPEQRGESDFSRFMRTVHPEDRNGVAQTVAKAINGNGHYEHEHRQLQADGQIRWISARARVEFNAEHKPVKMRGVAMDITARKLAEEQARESERQFLLIANSSPVIIWITGPDKLCTFVNEAWLQFRGRTFEQELGNGWADGVHPEDLDDSLKTYMESFDARQPFTMEYRARRHDGQYRCLVIHGVPRYDTQKNFVGYIGSAMDITERKEAEAAARQSQHELAHLSRVSTLGELAGSLAHELNQPLGAILSNAEAAQASVGRNGKHGQDVREALKAIVEQARRAGEIITGMRGMLKKDPAQMTHQHLNRIVKEVLAMLRGDLVFRQVRPVLRLDTELPAVNGHGVQLRQVMLNLVMNACDAMSENPKDHRQVIIETRFVTPNEVEVSVSDNGPGFTEEMLRHAFEPFRTTKANGLGLGLAICRSIITTHGGRFMVANNGGRGATLRFTLPTQNESGL